MIIDAARGALSYVVSHPAVLLQAARNAARFEASVPIDLLRWAIDRRPRGKGPERIELFQADPAVGVALTVDLFGTKLEVDAKIEIESIELQPDGLPIALRVSGLGLRAPEGSPAAMMIQSMDLSRPGNLMKMMPQKHAALLSAEDDRFVIDLLRIKALANNPKFRRVLAALSFIRVSHVSARGDLLALRLDVNPTKIPAAIGRATSA